MSESIPPDLTDAITENATGPRSAQGDSGSVQQHSLPDMILADKYINAKKALKNNPLGIRRVKLRPGGNHDIDFPNC